MKTFFKLTIVFLFFFTASQIEAQVRFGPEVGLNIAKITFQTPGNSMTPSRITAIHAGVDLEFHLLKAFYLQSGVMYSIKGTKVKNFGEEETINPNYIEIPVHLMGKFDIGGPEFLVIAGPYFAYGIAGKYKISGQSHNIQFGNNDNSDLKPFDFGLDLGVGFEISGVQLSGRYGFGLSNISPFSGTTLKNGVIEVCLAYMIGKK